MNQFSSPSCSENIRSYRHRRVVPFSLLFCMKYEVHHDVKFSQVGGLCSNCFNNSQTGAVAAEISWKQTIRRWWYQARLLPELWRALTLMLNTSCAAFKSPAFYCLSELKWEYMFVWMSDLLELIEQQNQRLQSPCNKTRQKAICIDWAHTAKCKRFILCLSTLSCSYQIKRQRNRTFSQQIWGFFRNGCPKTQN